MKNKWKWIVIGLGLTLACAFGYLGRSERASFVIILIAASLILLGIIFREPYMGIVFMLCSLQFQLFTFLSSNLSNFTSLTSLFGVGALVFYVAKAQNSLIQSESYDKRIYAATALLLLVIILGNMFNPINITISYAFTYLQLLIFIWLSARLFKTRQNLEKLMKLFVYTDIITLIISLQNYNLIPETDIINRLSGLEGNANLFGIYQSISILMLFYFVMKPGKIIIRLFLIIIAVGLIISLVLSGSRGAILFLAPAFALQLWRNQKNNFFIIMLILSIILVFAANIGTYLPMEFVQRITNIPTDILYGTDTIGLRYGLWKYAIELWLQKPILGIGSGMFVLFSINSQVLHGIRVLPAHNMYITYLTENGIVGLLLFLFIVIKSGINYDKVIRKNEKNSSLGKLAITWEAIMLCLLLNGTKADMNYNKLLWFCFAISFSAAIAISITAPNERELKQPRITNGLPCVPVANSITKTGKER
jgi:O-antigen ligase